MNVPRMIVLLSVMIVMGAVLGRAQIPSWESANPIVPIPDPPLGIGATEKYKTLTEFPDAPTPERVRLGRWLFFGKRLSADNPISFLRFHQPKRSFS